MNKPIRAVALFCMGLVLLLLGNVTYLQYVQADALNERSDNRRVTIATFSRERGAILVGREPIARSVPSDDQFKYQRVYPSKTAEIFAPITGWYNQYSATGVEESSKSVLSGDDASLFVTRLKDMATSKEPKGGSVELTLNAKAQKAAYDGLKALGNTQGSVVALEPSTGRVLAMASTPTFDPNKLSDHDLKKVSSEYEKLQKDDAEPLLNRSIQTTLPPGSVFKLVTAAAALDSGKYDKDSLVPGGPSYKLPLTSTTIDNGGRSCGTDKVSFSQALEQSCNTTFLQLADDLGDKEMKAQAEKFGFNSKDYFDDLAGLATSKYPGGMDRPQTAMSGMGQSSVTATPLQMAMVAAGIANNGEVMKPYLVEEKRSPDMDVIDTASPQVYSEAMKSSTASQLTDMLVNTVDKGTASPAAISGVKVAGKTGTAQTDGNAANNYAWFVSFAPADDPKVAVAVMIQRSDVKTGIAGGTLGGPIAKSVMEAVLEK